MNTNWLKRIQGCDVGITIDIFGNEQVYVTKPKYEPCLTTNNFKAIRFELFKQNFNQA